MSIDIKNNFLKLILVKMNIKYSCLRFIVYFIKMELWLKSMEKQGGQNERTRRYYDYIKTD